MQPRAHMNVGCWVLCTCVSRHVLYGLTRYSTMQEGAVWYGKVRNAAWRGSDIWYGEWVWGVGHGAFGKIHVW